MFNKDPSNELDHEDIPCFPTKLNEIVGRPGLIADCGTHGTPLLSRWPGPTRDLTTLLLWVEPTAEMQERLPIKSGTVQILSRTWPNEKHMATGCNVNKRWLQNPGLRSKRGPPQFGECRTRRVLPHHLDGWALATAPEIGNVQAPRSRSQTQTPE